MSLISQEESYLSVDCKECNFNLIASLTNTQGGTTFIERTIDQQVRKFQYYNFDKYTVFLNSQAFCSKLVKKVYHPFGHVNVLALPIVSGNWLIFKAQGPAFFIKLAVKIFCLV